MTERHEAVVIGFGPCGAVAAGMLGQAGFELLAIDRATEVYDKPRAIAIDHEILRLLDGMGVAEAVLPYTAPFPPSDHFGADGLPIRHIDMVPEPYPMGFVPTMVFTQPPVEEALRAHAAGLPGVTVELGTELIAIEPREDEVRLTLRDAHGNRRDVAAGTVVACDGASSFVRRSLGIAFEDLDFDEPWLVVDLRVSPSGLARLPVNAAQFCEPARPITYIVGPGNHRRFEIMLNPGEDPQSMQRPEAVMRLLSRWLAPGDAELWRAASYRFHALVASEWRRGRVFLAGDAAHQQPPFIGQGMCQGLRDVANLVWKLAAVRDGASPALLDTYGEERARHVRTLTTRIKAIGRQICERDPEAAKARDAALREQGGGRAPVVTRQEIVPPLETGLLARGSPGAGQLFPQPWVREGAGWKRMDRLAGTGWRVFLSTAAPPIPGALRIAPDGDLVERDGVADAWFAKHGAIAALVRPDHYVFGTAADLAQFDALRAQLTPMGIAA
ncbi:bifunctional 3-(3-hydroxy-phenyl)propionate/3-hydroxycinnamic acid hydroxylase [Falsiroseomonas sp. HW251]|uniref:bifunctional 3-(3-hydroxy-phenyl)propionate/3-hydroxycinnamic acid hydroxylase n=1 Tax=Falsiroseomonas sp. HW251 TaxID=3390998 RepID=UPI003D31D5EB